jgi:uncharacterized protein
MHVAKTADFSKESRELILYFLLAYGISLILWLPMLYENSHHHLSIVLLCIGTFGPTLAALITQRISVGNWKAVRLWTGLKNLSIGVASGGALVLLAAFTTAFFMTRSGFDHWRWPALLQILTLFGPNLLGGPLGEEAGWRGYALPRLQSRFSPVVSSLLLGFLWANWHLPLILAHVYNITWWQFVTMTMAASVFLTYCYNKSKGSTPAAIIVHGLYNVGTGCYSVSGLGRMMSRTMAFISATAAMNWRKGAARAAEGVELGGREAVLRVGAGEVGEFVEERFDDAGSTGLSMREMTSMSLSL